MQFAALLSQPDPWPTPTARNRLGIFGKLFPPCLDDTFFETMKSAHRPRHRPACVTATSHCDARGSWRHPSQRRQPALLPQVGHQGPAVLEPVRLGVVQAVLLQQLIELGKRGGAGHGAEQIALRPLHQVLGAALLIAAARVAKTVSKP